MLRTRHVSFFETTSRLGIVARARGYRPMNSLRLQTFAASAALVVALLGACSETPLVPTGADASTTQEPTDEPPSDPSDPLPAADAGGDGAEADDCSRVKCNTPPADYCIDQATLRSHPVQGKCAS